MTEVLRRITAAPVAVRDEPSWVEVSPSDFLNAHPRAPPCLVVEIIAGLVPNRCLIADSRTLFWTPVEIRVERGHRIFVRRSEADVDVACANHILLKQRVEQLEATGVHGSAFWCALRRRSLGRSFRMPRFARLPAGLPEDDVLDAVDAFMESSGGENCHDIFLRWDIATKAEVDGFTADIYRAWKTGVAGDSLVEQIALSRGADRQPA